MEINQVLSKNIRHHLHTNTGYQSQLTSEYLNFVLCFICFYKHLAEQSPNLQDFRKTRGYLSRRVELKFVGASLWALND